MSMTPASSQYFKENAGQWDSLRSGYFTEAVREAALAKAYLRPDMVVADVGAGTGYLTAALAPRVRRVYALDGSAEMLTVARQNLQGLDNVEYQEADGTSLPLPDDSLDAVFANMYLHHCPKPLAAIREMVRILRPGGRLIITDMDTHPYAWLKEEMADEWLGFDRPDVLAWFKEAGLVNVIVTGSGQSCCAESQQATLTGKAGQQARIGIFVAVGTKKVTGVREAVQEGYGATAAGEASCCRPSESTSSCCSSSSSSSCCSSNSGSEAVEFVTGYSAEDQAQVPDEAAEISLGCGNPLALANLKPGETVLDIGSGGGMDSFLAAQKVGTSGKVIGVDMTPAMLERARQTAEKSGFDQVEFRQGQAESLPVDDRSVDVILSNCVINLCEDKGKVFEEAYRVLRPGGRLEVSDMVASGSLPGDLREDPQNWAGCVFGALPEGEYLDLVAQAGFENITVHRSTSSGEAGGVSLYSLIVSARKPGGVARSACGCGCGGLT